ncbi:VPLPA-CTERM sorting domain-containing protein [Meridianimarinicoccus sp. RP-17]|uniref:VPLPA-CTERM sorting domain-containing protein n=1 Tax=Meridianimarinicoccus zhengii TaxID=2056810 RepID=UPI000DAB5535|nr:VPLPA-CTERM sorting domain-containing protein [Phycocomes zhengii]
MKFAITLFTATAFMSFGGAAVASSLYLNQDNISVSVGPGTGAGTSNNTFTRGFGIEKVIDAPSADAEEFHNQDTHIWYTFNDPASGLELLFDFGVSYDIETLHFWNYTGERYDVDEVVFTFFDALGSEIGTETVNPALGTSPGIRAQDIPLVSPLNTRSVTAFLTGTNGDIDFQNIGFTARVSDPDLDPTTPVPLPAAGWMLLAGAGTLLASRRLR